MQRIEYYLPLKFVFSSEGDPEAHVADVLTEDDYIKGGGAKLMGPLTQIPGVTIERVIPPVVQRQAAQLNLDPRAIIYHATPQAERDVHNHLRLAGLVRTDNAIKVLKTPLSKVR